jgi:molybdopterin/thiamine biosynthesis adenylyltransferase
MPSAERTAGSTLVIIGLGAIGSALLPLLRTLPQHTLVLVDGDTVEERNLARQPLYGPADAGRAKVDVAAARTDHQVLAHVRCVPHFLDAANAKDLLQQADLVADCTDDLHASRLLDRWCEELGIPLVSGAVHARQLQVITQHRDPASGVRTGLGSFFPGRIGPGQDGCDMSHVPVAASAMAAALMARRIMALLAGDHSLNGSMDLLDLDHGRWITLKASQPPGQDELIA